MFKESVYQPFTIKNQLSIIEGKGGFPTIEIDNEHANSSISIYGAQVLSYIPKGNVDNVGAGKQSQNKDLLFVSELAHFEAGKAIKGGIPICWPWFAKDNKELDAKMHGFVRDMLWQLDETSSTAQGETKVVLSVSNSEETLKQWPHKFKLTVTIKVGKTLSISLQTLNTGDSIFKITQALHTYFSLSDISQARIEGLDDVSYLDKVAGSTEGQTQSDDDIRVSAEVDRIYIDPPSELALFDEELEREISIKSSGSKTTVVWNPWVEISKQSVDLTDDSYLRFICVETANTAKDVVVVEPSKPLVIEVEYVVE